MQFKEFQLIAPPHTPFDGQGRLMLTSVDKQARLLAESSVDGVFVGGSTGECASLTVAERMQLAERWLDVAPGKGLDVIIQVGHNCQADAVQLAAHAQRIGADAVAAHAPSYARPTSVGALIEFLAPIAAAAEDLPFYFYDIPPATGVRLPMVEFLTAGPTAIPNLVGLKYSNDDLVQLQECVQLQSGAFRVLFGCDEILLSAAALGAQGAIGSTYNFAAPLYRRMLTALSDADFAQARGFQCQSVALVRLLMRYSFMAASKVLMEWLGVDCGKPRAPYSALTEDQRRSLRKELEALGFFAPPFLPEPIGKPQAAAQAPGLNRG